MGLRNRLKGRIKETLGGVSALARIIHDEANHPGRPQPHMAARNPLWGGGEVDGPEVEESSESTPETTPSTTESDPQESEESDYWFLHDPDGEADDWSLTNPKKK
jgi:hypothetical protein